MVSQLSYIYNANPYNWNDGLHIEWASYGADHAHKHDEQDRRWNAEQPSATLDR